VVDGDLQKASAGTSRIPGGQEGSWCLDSSNPSMRKGYMRAELRAATAARKRGSAPPSSSLLIGFAGFLMASLAQPDRTRGVEPTSNFGARGGRCTPEARFAGSRWDVERLQRGRHFFSAAAERDGLGPCLALQIIESSRAGAVLAHDHSCTPWVQGV